MSKKSVIDTANTAVSTALTLGNLAVITNPNQSWSMMLSIGLTAVAGIKEISNTLLGGIDLQELKNIVEKNPEDAQLVWTIIDSGAREAAKEKIRLYNSYLKGALDDSDKARTNNSKVLLVIQQITLDELAIFQKVYEQFLDLQIINLYHSVDSNNQTLKEILDSNDLNKWMIDFISKNNKGLSKTNYLKDIRFEQRGFTIIDFKKYASFSSIEVKNELKMLSSYGLLQSNEAMGGTIYKTTDFGNYFFDFAKQEIGSNE